MNDLYDGARVRMLSNQFDWATLDVRLVAARGPYTFLPENATLADAVADGAELVVTSIPFTGLMVRPGGYAASDTAVLPDVPASTDPVTFLLMTEAGSDLLIAYIDDAEGLPFAPNGQDQNVQPDWIHLRGWFRP